MLIARRRFLSLLGLCAAAVGVEVVAEPVRRIWQVGLGAPVRGHAYVGDPRFAWLGDSPELQRWLREAADRPGMVTIIESIDPETGIATVRLQVERDMAALNARVNYDGAPLFPERAAEQAYLAAGGTHPNGPGEGGWLSDMLRMLREQGTAPPGHSCPTLAEPAPNPVSFHAQLERAARRPIGVLESIDHETGMATARLGWRGPGTA